jgi:hypothetical protein
MLFCVKVFRYNPVYENRNLRLWVRVGDWNERVFGEMPWMMREQIVDYLKGVALRMRVREL